MSDGDWAVLCGLAMVVGVAGTLVPVLPGLLLVWAAALVYGLATGFGPGGLAAMAVITLLGAAGWALGLVLPHRAAGTSGASRASVWAAFGLGVVGFFVVPVVGLPLGVVVGLFLAEAARTRDAGAAWRSTWVTLKAFGVATLVQALAGLAMAAVWLVWALAA